MSDIKFRAWMKAAPDLGLPEPYIDYSDDCDDEIIGGWVRGNDDRVIKLMQYTGLKDKNGEEIYESDIVRWTSWSIRSGNKADKISEVIWRVGAWRLSGDETWVMAIYSNLEVIGNIYENPELLEKDDEK
jgi:uncharacterized phage protein (TIGR01671 family)